MNRRRIFLSLAMGLSLLCAKNFADIHSVQSVFDDFPEDLKHIEAHTNVSTMSLEMAYRTLSEAALLEKLLMKIYDLMSEKKKNIFDDETMDQNRYFQKIILNKLMIIAQVVKNIASKSPHKKQWEAIGKEATLSYHAIKKYGKNLDTLAPSL